LIDWKASDGSTQQQQQRQRHNGMRHHHDNPSCRNMRKRIASVLPYADPDKDKIAPGQNRSEIRRKI